MSDPAAPTQRVLITGATGLIGSALAASCARDGIQVAALVRDAAAAARRVPHATLHPWDATGGPPPEAAFEGVDVVVNLMGEPMAPRRWTVAQRKRLRDSRLVGTRSLVDMMRGLAHKPRLLVSASGTGYYGGRGAEILTESSSVGSGFVAELARDWEAEAERATELGVRVVRLRSGLVLAREGGALGKMLLPFRLGIGGPVGDGQQWLPWIHIADEVGLMRWLMDARGPATTGALNAVAPEPVTNAEFTTSLGQTLSRPTFMKAPAFAVRLALGGEMADQLLLASQRAMPVRTLETGFKFRYPLLRAALKDLLGTKTQDQEAPAPTTT